MKILEIMNRNSLVLFFLIGFGILLSCAKNEDTRTERFILLTTPSWTTDSLLANGVDASGPGEILEKFAGDAKFNEDGTGYFGQYTGTWTLVNQDANITINSDSLAFPITCFIEELTTSSFKITTNFPSQPFPIAIRITFKAK
jgi:hypothetical protein